MNSDLAHMTDQRYITIRGLLQTGEIKKFTEIFEWIPHSIVARDFGTSNNRMKQMITDPTRWKIAEVNKLAELIGYDEKKLGMMAAAETKEIMKGKEKPGS